MYVCMYVCVCVCVCVCVVYSPYAFNITSLITNHETELETLTLKPIKNSKIKVSQLRTVRILK